MLHWTRRQVEAIKFVVYPSAGKNTADVLIHQAALAKDVKRELESLLETLSGKGTKGKKPRGAERRKMWDEVKALRKEYRQREGGVVKSVLSESQIIVSTCHSAGSRQLGNMEFDVVLIDEATQALEAVCLFY